MKRIVTSVIIMCALACACIHADVEGLKGKNFNKDRIQPYSENPLYWQYKEKPILLLGGSKDDNLFQIPDLKEHLDLLASVGGNYIRNTMSSRPDKGFEVQPFKKLSNGKYDLDQWNDEYWNRFERMLKFTRDRDIIVQIEVWAFHDFNKGHWEKNPWRAANNICYSESGTTLKDSCSDIGKVVHNFFFTVPKLHNDSLVLAYQQKFVDKILSYSLRYGHVLYCITNEIHPQFAPEWGWYWSKYIREKATVMGSGVETTEMYWEIDLKKPQQRASLDRPDLFSFFEASQNSAKMAQQNWDNLQFVHHYLAEEPRPINHVKIYGANTSTWKGFTDRHATECFWRNIFGGSASSRFHRPPYGLGLSGKAQAHIKSMRMLTNEMDIFTCAPHNDLLSDRKPNKAYCLANPGKEYAVYFPDSGEVKLDISQLKRPGAIRWLEISAGKWGKQQVLKLARSVTLRPPGSGTWVALLVEGTVLPYGNRQRGVTIIYDNDQTRDVYTDEIMMAMASAGRIQLIGMITTRTVNGIGYDKYDELVAERKQMVNLARKSGMRHLPDPVKGTRVSLQPPASEKIEDTETIGSDGSWLIVHEARKASSNDPLIVICGGQLTAVADAYLLDPSIEDKVVVAALLGSDKDMRGFNGKQDPWAAYIVLQRLTYVQFPQSQAIPKVPKDWLRKTLPDTPLRQWMLAKIHPLFPDQLPDDEDNDGQPVLPLLTTEYVTEVKRVAFGGWESKRFGEGSVLIPTFTSVPPNGESRALVVVMANRDAGTQAWQAAMADPAAWHQTNDSVQYSGIVKLAETDIDERVVDFAYEDYALKAAGFDYLLKPVRKEELVVTLL